MMKEIFQNLEIIPIEDIRLPELRVFVQLNEPQLKRYFEPAPGLFVAESPKVILRALHAGYRPMSLLAESSCLDHDPGTLEVLNLLETSGSLSRIPVYTAPESVLVSITGFRLTRGLLCAFYRSALPAASELLQSAQHIAVLEDVVNPANVGAIFRNAAALNMDAVILTDKSSDPLYRRASRVSMGTVFQIPWTIMHGDHVIQELQEMGFKTAALALRKESVGIDDEALMREKRLAVVLGTEGEGLKKETIDACDYTVMIPMTHGVDSLNVSAAAAVAFWQLGRSGS